MKENEYSEIVLLEKLNEIKTTIHNSGFRIDYRRAYAVDQKMQHVIEQLYDENCEDQSLANLYRTLDTRINRRAIHTLTYYYFALYQDNLPLLEKMLQEDIGLMDEDNNMFFSLLDRDFTKYFSEEQYLFLLRNCREELLSFYRTVFAKNHTAMNMAHRKELLKELNTISLTLFSKDSALPSSERESLENRINEIAEEINMASSCRYPREERDQYCRKFVSIMTKDPFICKKPEEEQGSGIYSHLLTPAVFDLFDEERILQMSNTEKKYVSHYESTPVALARVKRIFEKYPDYHSDIRLEPDILRSFTDEELYYFPSENIAAYEKAINEGLLTRLRKIASQNESVLKHPAFIHRTVFDSLTDEEMAGLSEKAVVKISHMVLNTHFLNTDEEYRLCRASRRVMRIDQVIQKVKKILR